MIQPRSYDPLQNAYSINITYDLRITLLHHAPCTEFTVYELLLLWVGQLGCYRMCIHLQHCLPFSADVCRLPEVGVSVVAVSDIRMVNSNRTALLSALLQAYFTGGHSALAQINCYW